MGRRFNISYQCSGDFVDVHSPLSHEKTENCLVNGHGRGLDILHRENDHVSGHVRESGHAPEND